MELKHDDRMGKPAEWWVGSTTVEVPEKRMLKIQTSSTGDPELRVIVPNGKIWEVEISIRIHEIPKPAGSDGDE